MDYIPVEKKIGTSSSEGIVGDGYSETLEKLNEQLKSSGIPGEIINIEDGFFNRNIEGSSLEW